MITGANYQVTDGIIEWWNPLIFGDSLLAQSHEHRIKVRQGSYLVDLQYGNPFWSTLTQGVTTRELVLRLESEIREVSLQDGRIRECVIDLDSIEYRDAGRNLFFKYQLIKQDGEVIDREFGK